MDYIFSFGNAQKIYKIYRLDDKGIHICKKRRRSIVPRKTIAWKDVINAGEGVMTSPAYQQARNTVRAVTNILPHKNSREYEQGQAALATWNGFIIIAYTKGSSVKKKVVMLPINVSAEARESFLHELSSRLGNRWLGANQDPGELKKRIGIPMFYQIRGILILIALVFVFIALVYLIYFK